MFPPMQSDPVLAQVGEGIALHTTGDDEAARALFARLWDEVGEHGDALHRMALAHSMADVVTDPHESLRWDLRALEAAAHVTDERLRAAGITTTIQAFYPSLHLNLGEAYRRVGDFGRAAEHLERGCAALVHLDDDRSAPMFRDALERLAERLRTARAG